MIDVLVLVGMSVSLLGRAAGTSLSDLSPALCLFGFRVCQLWGPVCGGQIS